jgi:AraC-like DNA-binding protein
MQDSKPDLASVAQRIGFSVRTLQRELSDRGMDWSRLLDQVRLDHAATSLASETPICKIAHSLGYTDQANFGRAFRRWTGTTPKSYRKQVRNLKTKHA